METVSQSAPSVEDGDWHAQFSPSAADRWMNCPASIALAQNTSSKYADEGTAAHTLASRALEYQKDADFFIGEEIQVGNNIWVVTEEMAGYVQEYLDDLRGRVGDGTLMFEQRVYFSDAIGVPDQGGTSDGIILSGDCKRLTVEDLKYGMGVQVDAEENKQMMTYAVGTLETFSAIVDEVEEVTLVICQPRLGHISEWTCSIERLRQHAAELKEAAAQALYACEFVGEPIPHELFGPSEKACMWCSIKATCDAHRQHISAIVYDDFEVLDKPELLDVIGEPQVPAADRLGLLYGALNMVESWCTAVRAEVERMVAGGLDVIGPDGERMKLVEGKKGRRAWIDEAAAIAALAGQLTPDKYYQPQKVITVSAAEKLLGKGKGGKDRFREQFANVYTQAPGKAHVTLGSDPRPPYTPSADADEFDVVEDDE